MITSWISDRTLIHPTIGPTLYNSGLSLDGANVSTNARLTIYLRVLMLPNPIQTALPINIPDPADPSKTIQTKFIPVPDPNNKTQSYWVEVQDWNTSTFEMFKIFVKKQAEDFWDNTKLCLVPPKDLKALYFPATNPTHQLNLDCRFKIVWAKGFSDAHIVFWGTCLSGATATNNQIFPSFAGIGAGVGPGLGSIDTGDLFNRTVMSSEIGIAGPNTPIGRSNAIWHEFGHAIGLPHIGVTSMHQPCLQGMSSPQGGNFGKCYLGPTLDESLNVMGSGDKVSIKNSLPWLWRAPKHTGTHVLDWRVSSSIRRPRKL